MSPWSSRGFGLALALACMVWVAAPVHAQEPAYYSKIDQAVRAALESGEEVPVIVRFSSEDARERGRAVLSLVGRNVRRDFGLLRAFAAQADALTIETLATDAGVGSISLDARVRANASGPNPNASPIALSGPGRSSGARDAQAKNKVTGGGISVAIIDSGVAPHVDLERSRIRAFVDYVNGRTEPYDDFGHGTHVAGIVAGTGAASSNLVPSYAGIAPQANIVALKVLDATGTGRTSDVIAAIEWTVRNAAAHNIRVINLSLGHPVYEPAWRDPLVAAVEAASRAGIVVAVSAGNGGYDYDTDKHVYGSISSPGNAPSAVTVGAVNTWGTDYRSDDRVARYSARGPTRFELHAKPDVVAPGQSVVSLSVPGSYLFDNFSFQQVTANGEAVPAYFVLNGTSMSTPAVAGTAALMLDGNPGLSANTVKALIQFTAQRLPDADLFTQGAGYLNAAGAVRLAKLVNPAAPVNDYWLRTQTPPDAGDLLMGEEVAWSKRIVWNKWLVDGDLAYVHFRGWDDAVKWGTLGVLAQSANALSSQTSWDHSWSDSGEKVWGTVFLTDNIVWGTILGDNIVWGTLLRVDNIVWGTLLGLRNIVWGTELIDADNIVWATLLNPNNIVWATLRLDNIVWGTFLLDNIVWGTLRLDNIVWGTLRLDNIVWGTYRLDNIVWGTQILTGGGF